MNISWKIPLSTPLLTWFVFRAGIPTLIFLLGLGFGCPTWSGVLLGLLPGFLGMAVLGRALGARACLRPLRLFVFTTVALVWATIVAWISTSTVGRGFYLADRDDRIEQARALQSAIERVWSVEVVVVLLVLWLILVLTARLLHQELGLRGPRQRPPSRVLQGTAFLLALIAAANHYVATSPRIARPSRPDTILSGAKLKYQRGPVSFLDAGQVQRNPQFQQGWERALLKRDFDSWSDAELLELYDSVGPRLDAMADQDTMVDYSFLLGLTLTADRFEPGHGEIARWLVANLSRERRRKQECQLFETLDLFRPYTLVYLSQASMSFEEMDAFRHRAWGLYIEPDVALLSHRKVARVHNLDESPMLILGAAFSPLPWLYLDLEDRWVDILDGDVGAEAEIRALQPEWKSVALVLELKRHRLTNGEYPESLDTELGSYRRTSQGAELTLRELDPHRKEITLSFR